MLQKQAEYEEQIEIMLQKISQLEKAKSRLQSEVEVLIVDLEKAQNTIAILERAKEQLEKTVNELKVYRLLVKYCKRFFLLLIEIEI